MSQEIMIKIDNVVKQYKLGEIGGTTLRDELQRLNARLHHKEDPTKKIGAKDYNKGEIFRALNGVSFTVKKGERVGIIGHNGAGKSTLLKLISRVTTPTQGEIGLNGRITSMLEVGTGFHGELTGRENIYMNGAILGMTKKEIDAKMEDIIEFSECRQFIDTPVKRYSSGMYVKLAFSVAAHLDSEIMIMDEVLAVGDMAFQKKCLDKMNDVSREQGRTILYVSHNMNTIRQLCDRVVVLDHGKVVFDGDVEEGINIYMNVGVVNSTFIDYRVIPQNNRFLDLPIRMLSAKYVEKSAIVFSTDEQMKIELEWLNLRDVKDVCLRIELLSIDRSPIGTSFLYKFYSGKKDDIGKVQVQLDIPPLGPGQYTMNFALFNCSKMGGTVTLECVQGLYFNIDDNKEQLTWTPKYWGALHLPDLTLL